MPDAKYMREQAQRCFRLAQQITDAEVRLRLERLGHEFEQKATELEQAVEQPQGVPTKDG